MDFTQFLSRWAASGDAERANKDAFLVELCEVLGVERPHPKTGDPARDVYVFEKDVARAVEGGTSLGRIDLYKQGCFLLEAKQAGASGPKRRGTPAWNQLMSEAHGQALGYAAHLAEPPPFLLVCDLGHCFDVYASFDGSGHYRPFPDAAGRRLFLADLARHAPLLQAIWSDPHSLDPAKRSAAVTREIAGRIAELARALEAAGHDPEVVATFLMRCLFTMFAEDVGLLPGKLFSEALERYWLPHPESFPGGVAALWQAMDTGGNFITGKLLRFNGGLFATQTAPRLSAEQLALLLTAAQSDWSQVDPSIFGTLLERALNPRERHRLGAHYTPRAYVERLVRPTIEEPLRADWDLVRAEVRQLVEAGKEEAAQRRVLDFHHTLCRTRVLDPACGTGNFLYVTLDLFKRLESEVLTLLAELGYGQISLEMERFRVTPEQFLGIEVKRWAKEIAELVLWIGYLQWQVRQPGGALTVPQPVLRDYGNIECRDAVLAYDREELATDEAGRPVTRWDGTTMKPSPVTGEPIPDETAQVPVYRYVNPRRARWPQADFIVGNPPYIGNKRMRLALGDGYVEALRKVHDDVPGGADYVMFWWHTAADLVAQRQTRRFGLITTNSISQASNRKVVGGARAGKAPISLVFVVPDHPWVDSADGAAVRVAMTVAEAGSARGRLVTVVDEHSDDFGEAQVGLRERYGVIHADLTVGPEVLAATRLRANESISFQGPILVGEGFRLGREDLAELELKPDSLPRTVRPYVIGRDIVQAPAERWVIDFFGLGENEARKENPALFQRLLSRVKPERDANRDRGFREKWWVWGRPRPDMRNALAGLRRYIATVETSKHKPFVLLDASVCPDHKLYAIATGDAFFLGVLSSRVHLTWALAAGGRLGFGNDPTWTNSTCFLPFPFPACSEAQTQRIRELGEALDAHRKRQQALHPGLTLTGMYNVLEKLRAGEPLNAKEREIHEQGLVSILKQTHDDLDAAVFAAYGWPLDLTDEEVLERLVALNHERAEEEKRGLVRWLRPEFQNPAGERAATQATLAEAGLDTAAAPTAKATKAAWPKDLPGRLAAARDLLTTAGQATGADFPARFKHVKPAEAEQILASLAAVGLALELPPTAGVPRTWQAVR